MNSDTFEIVIVGGGIVGLGTALALTERYPGIGLAILEKEAELASHQTGHNSGVIHAGIYYKPGSAKAELCVEGVRLLKAFCEEQGVPYDNCGKVIAATEESELPQLQSLYERGVANGVPGLQLIGPERARELEPRVQALRAIHSPNTAIVDFRRVAGAMAHVIAGRGGRILTNSRVAAVRRTQGEPLLVETARGMVRAKNLLNCGGLYADRIARMAGARPEVMVVPFRGEYYTLRPESRVVRGLIYPVPNPEFPFLGVHFTKRIDGDPEAGPNAVLAFARQGYRLRDMNLPDLAEMLAYGGFWRMSARHWRTGLYEIYRSISRAAFLRALQKLVPDLEDRDLLPGGSGVRAQTVARNGALCDDFRIFEAPRAVHVLNAPSPAATASIAIGRRIAAVAARSFGLPS